MISAPFGLEGLLGTTQRQGKQYARIDTPDIEPMAGRLTILVNDLVSRGQP